MKGIELVDRLAMEYVRAHATSDMTPSDLLILYNAAFSELYPQVMAGR